MDMQDSSVLYSNGTDRITSTQVTINGTTYPLDDIATITIIAPVLKRAYGSVLIVLGLVLLVVGYLVWGVFLTPMLVGAVLLIGGIVMRVAVRENYTVLLKQRNTQLTKLPFPDRIHAEQFMHALVQAMNRATSS